MPGVENQENPIPATEGSDATTSAELVNVEPLLDMSECLFCLSSSPLEPKGEESRQADGSWSGDADLQGCGQWVASMDEPR